jgi:hypothetical protein
MDSMNHACDEEINASKSFARRRARFTQPNVRSTTGCTKLPAYTLSGWNGSSGFNCGQNFTAPQPH